MVYREGLCAWVDEFRFPSLFIRSLILTFLGEITIYDLTVGTTPLDQFHVFGDPSTMIQVSFETKPIEILRRMKNSQADDESHESNDPFSENVHVSRQSNFDRCSISEYFVSTIKHLISLLEIKSTNDIHGIVATTPDRGKENQSYASLNDRSSLGR